MKSMKNSVGHAFVAKMADEILKNCATSDEVMKQVATEYPLDQDSPAFKSRKTSLNGRSKILFQIRAAVLSKGRISTFDDTALRAYVNEPPVDTFLNATLKQQWKTQLQYVRDPDACPFSKGAQKELERIKLVPEAMHTLFMSKKDTIEMKRISEAALVQKNSTVLSVEDGRKLLEQATKLLENATAETTLPKLSISLILLSGRRLTEIMSANSSFEPMKSNTHACVFSGQLKKKDKGSKSYVIGLLCDFNLFIKGIKLLREKQAKSVTSVEKGDGGIDSLKEMSNEQVIRKYGSQLLIGLHRMIKNDVLDLPKCKIHDLRTIYMACIFKLFKWEGTFAYVCMQCLGHESMEESLHYNGGEVKGLDALENTFGSVAC